MPAFWFDPLINLTAISQVTQYVGLVPTISSTFSDPYTVARQLLSLDHMTGGRVGWNLVTSMTDIEAQNHSMTELPNHEARYARAQNLLQSCNTCLQTGKQQILLPIKSVVFS